VGWQLFVWLPALFVPVKLEKMPQSFVFVSRIVQFASVMTKYLITSFYK
jgi:hypothetical protein